MATRTTIKELKNHVGSSVELRGWVYNIRSSGKLRFLMMRDALMGLTEMARLQGGSSLRRAAAIEGLGMMLGTSPPFRLVDASRQGNYTVFSNWVRDLFQVAL